jgi:hypothetical protein
LSRRGSSFFDASGDFLPDDSFPLFFAWKALRVMKTSTALHTGMNPDDVQTATWTMLSRRATSSANRKNGKEILL